MLKLNAVAVVVALHFLATGPQAQSGPVFAFSEAGDQIVVDNPEQWRSWIYQNNLVRDVRSVMDSTGLFDF